MTEQIILKTLNLKFEFELLGTNPNKDANKGSADGKSQGKD